jgi:hypothetical protein
MKYIPLILALLAGPALADEPYAGYERERAETNYIKRVASRDWWSDCGRRITTRECNRIKAKDAQRSRYASDRDEQRRDYDKPLKSQCASETYTMEGAKNVSGLLARMNAREAWRRKVRSLHGTRYEDVNYAVNQTKPQKCWSEGMFTRCEFRARPCKA